MVMVIMMYDFDWSDLNVLDWGSSNLLAVALGTTVYVFDVARGDIQQLCDVEAEEGEGPQYVSSLRWDQTGQQIAVATNMAEIKVGLMSGRQIK